MKEHQRAIPVSVFQEDFFENLLRPCDNGGISLLLEQMFAFPFFVLFVSFVLVAIMASAVPSVNSLRAQNQRLLLLSKDQKIMRSKVLIEANKMMTINQKTRPFRNFMIFCIILLITFFEIIEFVAENQRSPYSSTAVIHFIQNWWIIVILQTISTFLGILASFELLFENVPDCLNLIKIQLSQLARALDGIDTIIRDDPPRIDFIRNWLQVRNFIVKYDQGYLYNTLNGALGATVLITILGSGFTILEIFAIKSFVINNEGTSVLNDIADLYTFIMSVFVGLLGAITSWVYLTYLNEIQQWHQEIISSVKLRKLDLDYFLKITENSTSNEGKNYRDVIYDETNTDTVNATQSRSKMVSQQSTPSRTPYFGDKDYSLLPTSRLYYGDILDFYTTIITELTEFQYPPTLFGFEYTPGMLTALKGYIFASIAAIGYLGYSVLL